MRAYLLYLLLYCFAVCNSASAQSVANKVHDFGKVEDWNNPPAIFTVKNTGKSSLLFLPTFTGQDLRVELPGQIAPGEQAEITIYYYTADKGPFTKKIAIYSNANDSPLELTIKGDIHSLSSTAFTSCPSFGPNNGANKIPPQEVLVIDKATRHAIPVAHVQMGRDNQTEIDVHTNRDGLAIIKTYMGNYHIVAQKDGYKTLSYEQLLVPSNGRLVLELEKIIDPKQPVVTNDTMVFEEVAEAPPVPQIDVSTIPDKDSTGELSKVKFAPNNVVFLIDVSNSMKSPIKLPLLKDGMKQLLGVLRDVDQVTVIAYANTVWTVVQTTKSSDSNKDSISLKVDSLAAGGGTHGFQGLEGAYSAIASHYIRGGNNQVFIATDGLFNGSGDKSRQNVLNLAKDKSDQGITLSVIGFGSEPEGLKLMKEMADAGKGSFIHFTKGCDPGTLLVDEIKNRSIVTHVAHP